MSGIVVAWALAGVALVLAALQWRARAAGAVGVQRACHELRGPITAARLGLQLGARTGELSPASLRALDLELGRAGLALDDLARPVRGLVARGPADPVDVAKLLQDSVLAWRATAKLHDADLHVRWLGGPATVRGDRLRLAQVTGNLIANAIEHGGGQISVTGAGDGGWVRVEVRDSGPGLPAGLDQLLRRAVARPRRGKGAAGADRLHGHGLAIAARITAQHRGRLSAVDGEPGACVVLELPAAT